LHNPEDALTILCRVSNQLILCLQVRSAPPVRQKKAKGWSTEDGTSTSGQRAD
jgi:hypothetical protein